ncbi:MAG: clan AA aspartic protease [Candidatus Competibacteraceae bacterium]
MGEVRTKCLIGNPLKPGSALLEVDALVDTGAVLPLLGRDIVDKLGLAITRKAIVTLANETSEEMDVAGPISLEIGDRKSYFECLVGPVLVEPLLGQVVLEVLDLVVDSRRHTLSPRPESPAYPSYKLK